MEYRRLGKSGLKISQFSFGSWVTFGNQMDIKPVVEAMAAAKDAGVNFFDNAEVYANGKSEELMGLALKELKWPRLDYLVSTKLFWGLSKSPNATHTLNRKYLLESMHHCLERLQLDHVDLVYCHRPDPNTPIEETVWAMHDMIQRGQALYWGTSEWSAEEIRGACEIAERHHLHKPVVEQPQYNLFTRARVENEYARLYDDVGLGLTTWSPLASGLLTGKYLNGVPKGSRASVSGMAWALEAANDKAKIAPVQELVKMSKEMECTPAQLALAWCSKNPRVSSVITGASRVEQVVENMKAVEVYKRLGESEMENLNRVFPVTPRPLEG